LQLGEHTQIVYRSRFMPIARGRGSCDSTVYLEEVPPLPAPVRIEWSDALVRRAPSVAQRHYSLRKLPAPTDRVEMLVECNIDKALGSLTCTNEPSTDPERTYAKAANDRLSHMRLDVTGSDPDDPRPLVVSVPIIIDPSDWRSVDITRPRLPISAGVVVARASADEASKLYPTKLLRAGFEREVTLACAIQEDGSIVCDSVDPLPSGEGSLPIEAHHAFTDAALSVMSLHKLGPTLKSGEPSAGNIVEVKVAFVSESKKRKAASDNR
jgi:hypothetical protein